MHPIHPAHNLTTPLPPPHRSRIHQDTAPGLGRASFDLGRDTTPRAHDMSGWPAGDPPGPHQGGLQQQQSPYAAGPGFPSPLHRPGRFTPGGQGGDLTSPPSAQRSIASSAAQDHEKMAALASLAQQHGSMLSSPWMYAAASWQQGGGTPGGSGGSGGGATGIAAPGNTPRAPQGHSDEFGEAPGIDPSLLLGK